MWFNKLGLRKLIDESIYEFAIYNKPEENRQLATTKILSTPLKLHFLNDFNRAKYMICCINVRKKLG